MWRISRGVGGMGNKGATNLILELEVEVEVEEEVPVKWEWEAAKQWEAAREASFRT